MLEHLCCRKLFRYAGHQKLISSTSLTFGPTAIAVRRSRSLPVVSAVTFAETTKSFSQGTFEHISHQSCCFSQREFHNFLVGSCWTCPSTQRPRDNSSTRQSNMGQGSRPRHSEQTPAQWADPGKVIWDKTCWSKNMLKTKVVQNMIAKMK